MSPSTLSGSRSLAKSSHVRIDSQASDRGQSAVGAQVVDIRRGGTESGTAADSIRVPFDSVRASAYRPRFVPEGVSAGGASPPER